MVSSLDGFIAKKDNSITWMESNDQYENGMELTEEAINAFLESIDCYVMGSRTYEQALQLGWPYGEKPVYVLTSRDLPKERANVQFYSGDLAPFLNKQLRSRHKNIWIVGGSMLTKELIRQQFVDEIVVSILPILLGDGLLFFDFIGHECSLHLKTVNTYKDGMVELTYSIKTDRE